MSILFPRGSYVLKHKTFLQELTRAAKDPEKIRQILTRANSCQLKALSEIFQNFLQRNFPKNKRSKGVLKKLFPHRSLIRKLSQPKCPAQKKKELLLRKNKQSGGLPFLIPLLAPLVGSLLSAGIQAAV